MRLNHNSKSHLQMELREIPYIHRTYTIKLLYTYNSITGLHIVIVDSVFIRIAELALGQHKTTTTKYESEKKKLSHFKYCIVVFLSTNFFFHFLHTHATFGVFIQHLYLLGDLQVYKRPSIFIHVLVRYCVTFSLVVVRFCQ